MIDRRHPDGGLRVLISCLFEMLYPSFSFFFRFKIFVFRSCMRIYKYIRCYPGNVSVAFLSRCAVRELIFLSSRNLSPIYREISSHELANFACDLIPLCCKSEARPHASHACESMPRGKIERNINARALANYFGPKR